MTDAFDYSQLAPDDATFAADAATRIRERLQASVIDVGRDLAAVKARLDHGAFSSWLAAEFDMNQRSAQRYMAGARLADTKCDTVSYLPPTAIYALAAPSTPEAAQDAIVSRLKAGERVTTDVVKAVVREAKEAAKTARLTPDVIKKQRAKEARAAKRDADNSAAWQRASEERKAEADRVVDHLVEYLGSDGVGMVKDLLIDTSSWLEIGSAWNRRVSPKGFLVPSVRELPSHELHGLDIRAVQRFVNSICIDRRTLATQLQRLIKNQSWTNYEYVPLRRHSSPTLQHCIDSRGAAGLGLKIDVAELRNILSVFPDGQEALKAFDDQLHRDNLAAGEKS